MNCPLCHKEVVIKNKQVGTDENGQPIVCRYAICYDCKKQWNLDKAKIKHRAPDSRTDNAEAPQDEIPDGHVSEEAVTSSVAAPDSPVSDPVAQNDLSAPENDREDAQTTDENVSHKDAARPVRRRPAHKKRPEAQTGQTQTGQGRKKYGNIPPAHVRHTSEISVKKGYEDMLSTSSMSKKELRAAAKRAAMERKVHRQESEDPISQEHAQRRQRPHSHRHETDLSHDRRAARKEHAAPAHHTHREPVDTYDHTEDHIHLRIPRVILGLLSLIAFAAFAYRGVSVALHSQTGFKGHPITLLTIAGCCLLSALFFLILQKKNTVFAFILPIIFFGAAAAYGYINKGGSRLMIYAIGAFAAMALITLVLLVIYLTSGDGYDEDYDDDDFTDY